MSFAKNSNINFLRESLSVGANPAVRVVKALSSKLHIPSAGEMHLVFEKRSQVARQAT